jgi:predicted component of type VI protein secretion system
MDGTLSPDARTQTLEPEDALGGDDEDDGPARQVIRLIPVTEGLKATIVTDGLSIGRGSKNAVQLKGKQRISLKHVSFFLSPADSAVFAVDTSTNGTSVNGVRLTKGKQVELTAGDEIDLAGEVSYIVQAPKKVLEHVPAVCVAPAAPTPAAAAASPDGGMGSHLTCGICQEIVRCSCT